MKKDPVIMTLLYDYYGETLTRKQAEIYEMYHNADLSLSEIAENCGITRQGVHDLLTRAEQSMCDLEEKLGFVSRFRAQKERADKIYRWLDEMEALNRRTLSSPQLGVCLHNVRQAVEEMAGA